MSHYCCSFVCGAEADCTCECVGCQFLYDCEFCNNTSCEHYGKSEKEIDEYYHDASEEELRKMGCFNNLAEGENDEM